MVDLSLTLWSPDTCRCSMFYSWDKDLLPIDRIHAYVGDTAVQATADGIRAGKGQRPKLQPAPVLCPAHVALGHTEAMFNAVSGENTRKNISLRLATDEKADLDISQVLWSFDVNRVLRLQIDGQLTVAQLASLQSSVDLQFGPGKVVIVGTPAPDAIITVGSDPNVLRGAQTTLNVVVSSLPQGLAGFEASAQITPAGAAKFIDVFFPAYASFPTHTPDPVNGPVLTRIAAVDLARLAEGALFNFLLFQLRIESITGAPVRVTVDVTQLDDDLGNDITRKTVAGKVN